jgi:hypothetical protein
MVKRGFSRNTIVNSAWKIGRNVQNSNAQFGMIQTWIAPTVTKKKKIVKKMREVIPYFSNSIF